jgi:trimeric autotransporter adhesin
MLMKQSREFQLISGLILFLALISGIGCTGFFVNPTLSTLTVGPQTATIQQGSTLQMSATGTFDDGSTKSLTNSAFWSTSDSTVASVGSTGLVTGVAPGTATITAESGTTVGSTSITIQLGNITSIAVTPTNSTMNQGSTQQFTAKATTSGGTTEDITSSATWASSNTNAGTIDSNGLFTAAPSVTSPQTTIITATSGNVSSPSSGPTAATVTVNP